MRICITCGETTATARTIDNVILILDPEPTVNGPLVLLNGEGIEDDPTAVYGEQVDERLRYSEHQYHYAPYPN